MLEDQVAYLLQRYLGNYVRGLNKETLKISVWKGSITSTRLLAISPRYWLYNRLITVCVEFDIVIGPITEIFDYSLLLVISSVSS